MQSSKITKQDNVVNAVLLENCLRLPGKANIEVELKKGTEIVSSFYIPVIIEKSSKENVTSDDVPNFIEIFENAATEEEKRITTENARNAAEQARGEAEAERVTNENNRSNAETNRAEAETERVDSETSRNTSEANREEAEIARITAENARNVAEQARVEAEAVRVAAEEERQQSMSKLIVEDIRSKNMFDKNAVVAGALNADGSIEQMEGIYTSDFIQVEPNKTYYKGQSDSIRFKFYDANKTAISSTYTDIQNAGNAQAFTVPYTAYYIRFSVTQNYLSTLQVEQGTQATEYCRHFDFNTIEEVVKNENGTAIKYSNGIMKCFGNIIIQAVNFDRAYGNMYIESIGYRNFSFSEKFVDDSYFLNLYPKNFGGGVGGVCGAAYNTQTATYWLWHSSAYDFSEKTLEISYEAIGRWK